jgi:hypothetical protein
MASRIKHRRDSLNKIRHPKARFLRPNGRPPPPRRTSLPFVTSCAVDFVAPPFTGGIFISPRTGPSYPDSLNRYPSRTASRAPSCSCPTNSKTISKSPASRFAVRGPILGNREPQARACPLRALSFDLFGSEMSARYRRRFFFEGFPAELPTPVL